MFKTIACVFALAAAVPAVADTRVVRYDDLNLATTSSVERLETHIHNAAHQVCGARDDYRKSLMLEAATRKCVADAKAKAMAQVAQLEAGAARGG